MLVSGILIAGCSSGSDQKMSIIELVPENDEVLVNEKTDIEIKTDPKDTALTASDFVAGKGKIEVDGNLAVFCASETEHIRLKLPKTELQVIRFRLKWLMLKAIQKCRNQKKPPMITRLQIKTSRILLVKTNSTDRSSINNDGPL